MRRTVSKRQRVLQHTRVAAPLNNGDRYSGKVALTPKGDFAVVRPSERRKMSNDSNPPSHVQPEKVGIDGIYVSKALFKEIMDATIDDMRMVYRSATSELGQPDAKRLICGLGEADPTWFKAMPELKPVKSDSDPALGSDGNRTP